MGGELTGIPAFDRVELRKAGVGPVVFSFM